MAGCRAYLVVLEYRLCKSLEFRVGPGSLNDCGFLADRSDAIVPVSLAGDRPHAHRAAARSKAHANTARLMLRLPRPHHALGKPTLRAVSWPSKHGTITMETYLLTGNPDARQGGMDEARYNELQRECVRDAAMRDALTADTWTVGYARNDEASLRRAIKRHETLSGHAVLLRQGGNKVEERGIIGFGQRLAGVPRCWPQPGRMTRLEARIEFYNLAPLRRRPFISADDLQTRGWKPYLVGIPFSGHRLTSDEVAILEACCNCILQLSLSSLCSEYQPAALARVGDDAGQVSRCSTITQ